MNYLLTAPDKLDTTIQLPASKSISNRALILNKLAHGKELPANLSDCDDTEVMVKALQGQENEIDILAAGTAMRFLTAYYSTIPGTRIITGTQRMQERPIQILVDALRLLGARIEYVKQEGFPPLRITGEALNGGEISLPGNVSSQYISALLMIGAILPQGLTIHLTGNIISRPYIELTRALMHDFGAVTNWINNYSIQVLPQPYQPTSYQIESDWSAASYWYEMAALSKGKGRIHLLGLKANSYQGDSRGAEIFEKLGVQTTYSPEGIWLQKGETCVKELNEDLVDVPDLAQTFVVTCCLKEIPFRFTGLQSLKIKETDRINALITELHKLGYVLHSENDRILCWDGEHGEPENHPVISTYEDHRMAMAFAPACFMMPNLEIAHPQVVSKSYPHYWRDLLKAGFTIQEKKEIG